MVPQRWVCGLAGSGLLNFLRMPYFGRYNITDRLARQLLALIHNDNLWIRDIIPIDAELIHKITGLPKQGPHPLAEVGKKYEAATASYFWKTYAIQRNQRGFLIQTINDPTTQLGTRLLACKLMRRCQIATIPAYVIQLARQCVKGEFFNWA